MLLYLFIFMIVRRLSSDLSGGAEPIGMAGKTAEPVVPPQPSAAASSGRVAPLPAPTVGAPSSAAPPVVTAASPAPRQDRERTPEAPQPQAETDSSTREFDYLVTKLSPRLVVQHSKVVDDGAVFEVKGGATIGRSPRSQIVLPDDFVSSTHARIFARKQFLYLEDLGSTNGTFIDGRRIEGEHQIKPGQEIVIGDTIFRFEE